MIEYYTYTFYLADNLKSKDRLKVELRNLRKALDDFTRKWKRKPDSILLIKSHPLLLIKDKQTTFTKIPIKINNGVGINQMWLERNDDEITQ